MITDAAETMPEAVTPWQAEQEEHLLWVLWGDGYRGGGAQ